MLVTRGLCCRGDDARGPFRPWPHPRVATAIVRPHHRHGSTDALEVALTDDVLVVHGGTPLQGRDPRPRREEPGLQGDGRRPARRHARAGCSTCRRSATSRSSAACSSCTASRSPTATSDGELVLDPTNVESASIDEINVHAGSSRIPILFCGPLLHRLGHAFIPDLGGCHIGDRPIDFHLAGAARVRRDRRQDARGPAPDRAERAARHQVRAAVPERRRDRAGAADRRAAPRASPSCATRRSSRRSST